MMNKVIMLMAIAVTAVGSAVADGTAAYAKAMGGIDSVIAEPARMTAVMKSLSAEEQRNYIAAVGEAVSKLPASAEEKTAKLVNLTHVALKAANKGNVAEMIAEIIATYPPEALPVVCERIGTDLINRAGNPNVTYTDKEFTDIAITTMEKVNKRTAEADNSAARSAFAIVMFSEASNGTPPDLVEKLIDTLPEASREVARTEWLPPTQNKDGKGGSYEALLGSMSAGATPNPSMVLDIAGPQMLDSVLSDITGMNTDRTALIDGRTPIVDAVTSHLDRRSSVLANSVSEQGRSSQPAGGDADPVKGPSPEPGPYQWQSK